jgi:pimeloyl-ACP methyl ester carboxylesterase
MIQHRNCVTMCKTKTTTPPIRRRRRNMTFCAIVPALFYCSVLFCSTKLHGQTVSAPSIPFGDNTNAGHHVVLNSVKLYYEIYGEGDPLILLHGNGGKIEAMKHQIQYFAAHYKVIVMDCRGRGKSELGPEPLTYEMMTRDVASLMDHLHFHSAYVVGRSDGGIIALLMGIYFPEKVKKIAAFGANISPDTNAVYSSATEEKDLRQAEEMIQKKDTRRNWVLIRELNNLMVNQPHISTNDLKKIKCPVLVLSCDRDVIREEHTLLIYRSIPNSNLCIFPNETHWITSENPALFNAAVGKFLSDAFRGDEARK